MILMKPQNQEKYSINQALYYSHQFYTPPLLNKPTSLHF